MIRPILRCLVLLAPLAMGGCVTHYGAYYGQAPRHSSYHGHSYSYRYSHAPYWYGGHGHYQPHRYGYRYGHGRHRH